MGQQVALSGDATLDVDRGCLLRAGRPVHLRRQTYEVLRFLTEHRGRLVGKERFIKEIWQGRAVTDGSLAKCIEELREAVGEEAARLIRTVRGRGYIFDVDESLVDVDPGDAPAPRQRQVEAEPAPASTAPTPRDAAPVGSARRYVRIALAVVSAGLVATAAWVVARPAPATGEAPAVRPEVVIGPITAAAGDGELQMLALSITDLLEGHLARIHGFAVHAFRGEPTAAAEGVAPPGARSRLTGGLHRTPAGGHLSLRLEQPHVATGVEITPVGEYDIPFLDTDTSLASHLEVRERIAQRVVAALAAAGNDLLPAGEAARPRNAEAYRLYLVASGRLNASSTCDPDGLDLAKRSLAIDSQFSPAWALLGWAYYNRAAICGENATVQYRLAMEAADRALALSPAFDDARLLRATVLAETGRVEEAFANLKAAGPRPSADLAFARAYALTYAGYLAQARQEIEVMAGLDPMFLTDGGWSPNALLYAGDIARYSRLLPGTDTPYFRLYRGLAELQRGQPDAARQAVAGAFKANPHDVFARLGFALEAILAGRTTEGRSAVVALARQRDAVGSCDGEMTFKQAQLLALAGDEPGALDELERAVRQGFFCVECMDGSAMFARLRQTPAYHVILNEAHERHRSFGERFALHD